MADDIVTRLRRECDFIGCWHSFFQWERPCLFCLSAEEIERLRSVAMTLIDELRQNGGYEAYTPEMLFQEFYDEAHRG